MTARKENYQCSAVISKNVILIIYITVIVIYKDDALTDDVRNRTAASACP